MINDVERLSTEDLKVLLNKQVSRFRKAIDGGATFDELKDIRLGLREIETELKKRIDKML